MKKLILFLLLLLCLVSCGPKYKVWVKVGDERITVTKDYIYVQECVTNNALFVGPTWKQKAIYKITEKDSLLIADIHNLLNQ